VRGLTDDDDEHPGGTARRPVRPGSPGSPVTISVNTHPTRGHIAVPQSAAVELKLGAVKFCCANAADVKYVVPEMPFASAQNGAPVSTRRQTSPFAFVVPVEEYCGPCAVTVAFARR
jgi:hypothetical protein